MMGFLNHGEGTVIGQEIGGGVSSD
jgi:hypothetical protein